MVTKCIKCGANPAVHDVALHRLNWKGRPGIWACPEHYEAMKAHLCPDEDPTRRDPCLPPLDPDDELRDLGPWTGGIVDA